MVNFLIIGLESNSWSSPDRVLALIPIVIVIIYLVPGFSILVFYWNKFALIKFSYLIRAAFVISDFVLSIDK